MRPFSRLLGFAFPAALLLAGPSGAFSVSASDVPAGVSSAMVGDILFESSPRAFAHKSNLGFTGLGVKGGYVSGEIDGKGESITVTFAAPVILSEIVLGHLFAVDNYGDQVSEVARIEVLGTADAFVAGDLSVVTGTVATWSGSDGVVTNLSPGLEGSGGLWAIADPFGTLAVQAIRFHPITVGSARKAHNSDFSFVSLSGAAAGTAVPEPGTAALLGLGLGGLAVAGRRRAPLA